MKCKCVKIVIFISLILVLISSISTYAHPYKLLIEYDPCKDNDEEKMWYFIPSDGMSQDHLSDTITTVTYYITDDDSSVGLADIADEVLEDIKNVYIESMLTWNNIFYYTYDENGNKTAKKVVNIVEGNSVDSSNIIITFYHNCSYFALTVSSGQNPIKPNTTDSMHNHYQKWYMKVNIDHFYAHDGYYDSNNVWIAKKTEDEALICRARTGAHEVGHVFGLLDVDKYCGVITSSGHHEEILMGFGDVVSRTTHITYKDIAGVSITRGFHTDDDHRWMIRTKENGSTYLICSLCNGIRTEFDLEDDGTYEGQVPVVYGSCNDDHSLTGGNMLLVATDGIRDFYKCMKCRYIEEVDHSHRYTQWAPYNETEHREMCVCGWLGTNTAGHVIRSTDVVGSSAPCIGCGYLVTIDPLGPPGQIIHSVQKVSVNGSYILPNGIVVLVDEDIEAYESGTLVFYDKDDLPVLE